MGVEGGPRCEETRTREAYRRLAFVVSAALYESRFAFLNQHLLSLLPGPSLNCAPLLHLLVVSR